MLFAFKVKSRFPQDLTFLTRETSDKFKLNSGDLPFIKAGVKLWVWKRLPYPCSH